MSHLHGVFAPIVTPFRHSDGEVDLPWFKGYLAYLRAHSCDGIVPCGTNGEAASLSVAERQLVVETTVAYAGGMTVIAGTGAAALPDTITLTRHAFAAGTAAVLVMPPFYFKHPPDAGVAAWYQHVFDAAVPPGGKIILYHIAQTTGVPITDELINTLLVSHREVIYGIKDSSGDRELGRHFRQSFPALAYFAGNDHCVVEACLDDGAGSITACANVFPGLVAAAQRSARTKSDPELAQATLSAVRSVLEAYPLQPATKAALVKVAGLPPTAVRSPQVELTPAQLAELQTALRPEWALPR